MKVPRHRAATVVGRVLATGEAYSRPAQHKVGTKGLAGKQAVASGSEARCHGMGSPEGIEAALAAAGAGSAPFA
jgi:hypothetical protein